jgi:hypothetical protein
MIEVRTAEKIERDNAEGKGQETGPTDPRIIYYGPHECDVCGRTICRVALEQGGDKFDYPEGPIYPNTEWRKHSCNIDRKENQS